MDITVDNRKQVDYCLENKFTVDKGIKESELCLLDISTKMDPEEDELVRILLIKLGTIQRTLGNS